MGWAGICCSRNQKLHPALAHGLAQHVGHLLLPSLSHEQDAGWTRISSPGWDASVGKWQLNLLPPALACGLFLVADFCPVILIVCGWK